MTSSFPLSISFCLTDEYLLVVTKKGTISLFVAEPEPSIASGTMALPLFPFDDLDKTSQSYDFYGSDISI